MEDLFISKDNIELDGTAREYSPIAMPDEKIEIYVEKAIDKHFNYGVREVLYNELMQRVKNKADVLIEEYIETLFAKEIIFKDTLGKTKVFNNFKILIEETVKERLSGIDTWKIIYSKLKESLSDYMLDNSEEISNIIISGFVKNLKGE